MEKNVPIVQKLKVSDAVDVSYFITVAIIAQDVKSLHEGTEQADHWGYPGTGPSGMSALHLGLFTMCLQLENSGV